MNQPLFDDLNEEFQSSELIDLDGTSQSSFCLVTQTKQKFLLRLKNHANTELGASTQREIEVLQYLSSLPQVPNLILNSATYLILEWMKGENIQKWECENIIKLAELLSQPLFSDKNLHLQVTSEPLNYYKSVNHLLSQLPPVIQKDFEQEFKYLPHINFQYNHLVHNDLHRGNILLTQSGQLQLIDWDYAGIGDIYFEIAQLFVNENWSLAQLKCFYQHYDLLNYDFDIFYKKLNDYIGWVKFLNKLWYICHQQVECNSY